MDGIVEGVLTSDAVTEAVQNVVALVVVTVIGWLGMMAAKLMARLTDVAKQNATVGRLEEIWQLRQTIESAAMSAAKEAFLKGWTGPTLLTNGVAMMRASSPEAIRDIAPPWAPVTDEVLETKLLSAFYELRDGKTSPPPQF